MREVVRGDKHNLRKSANRNAQIMAVSFTPHIVLICAFQFADSRSYWLDYKNGWFLESVANLKMAGATHAETSF